MRKFARPLSTRAVWRGQLRSPPSWVWSKHGLRRSAVVGPHGTLKLAVGGAPAGCRSRRPSAGRSVVQVARVEVRQRHQPARPRSPRTATQLSVRQSTQQRRHGRRSVRSSGVTTVSAGPIDPAGGHPAVVPCVRSMPTRDGGCVLGSTCAPAAGRAGACEARYARACARNRFELKF
jgi:hypothetical protein